LPEANTWLVLISSAPYGSSRASAGIDAILACGAFSQSVSVVLKGSGRELLRASQVPPEGHRNLYKQLTSLPLYDVERIYVVAEDNEHPTHLPTTTIEDLAVTTIDTHQFGDMIKSTRHVLTF